MPWSLNTAQCRNFEVSSKREWMLGNGIGGYAMGSVSGASTRRYHGHLVAALASSIDRIVLLANIEAFADAGTGLVPLSTNQYVGTVHPQGYLGLDVFEVGEVAIWRFKSGAVSVEKRLRMEHGANACVVEYRNTGKVPITSSLRPLVCHKPYHHTMVYRADYPEAIERETGQTIVKDDGIELILSHPGAEVAEISEWYHRIEHLRDFERGLEACTDFFCPCELTYRLDPGESCSLRAEAPGERQSVPALQVTPGKGLEAQLQEAAGQFVVRGEAGKILLAGYPWFTDWGRDTMIAIPGVCLATGRWDDAKDLILRAISQMQDGLIPNRSSDSDGELEYNTADATLWMGNAIYRTLLGRWDDEFAHTCLAAMEQVVHAHLAGTSNDIRVDPSDGLLSQGNPGTQLTWMDARVDGVPVTARHGKAIEINGLWINFLGVLAWVADRLGNPTSEFAQIHAQATGSFEAKFWRPNLGYYSDTVEPDDSSLRPSQVIALCLPFLESDPKHAKLALSIVGQKLVTPRGLRTLSPDDPRYRGRFKGSLPELDSAYHQGTAWPWLLGPYVSALVRFTGDEAAGRRILQQATAMLTEYGLGGIAEVYDGDIPQQPGGCPWQAWSVGEILRAAQEIGLTGQRT